MQLTGMDRSSINKARRKLQEMKLISVSKKGYSQVLSYSVQKDYHKWVVYPKKGIAKKGYTQKGLELYPKKVPNCIQKGHPTIDNTINTLTIDKKTGEPAAEHFNKPTEDQKKEMALIHVALMKHRFNLYTFMARIKKAKGYFPPVDAIIKIGNQAVKSKPENVWGYFIQALKSELPKYFADLNIREAQVLKNGPVRIGDILKKEGA